MIASRGVISRVWRGNVFEAWDESKRAGLAEDSALVSLAVR